MSDTTSASDTESGSEPPPAPEEAAAEPVAASGGSGHAQPPEVVSSVVSVVNVAPDPIPMRNMLQHEAEKLAALPRHRRDDFWTAALWGFVASLTGGYQGLTDILAAEPVSKLFDLVEIVISVAAVSILVFGTLRLGRVETSDDYLKELFKIPKQKPIKIAERLRECWFVLTR